MTAAIRRMPDSTAYVVGIGRRELAAAKKLLDQGEYQPEDGEAVIRDLQLAVRLLVRQLDPHGVVPAARPDNRLVQVLTGAARTIGARPLSARPEVLDTLASQVCPGGAWPPREGAERGELFARAVAATARAAGVVGAPEALADLVDAWGHGSDMYTVSAVLYAAADHADAEAVTS